MLGPALDVVASMIPRIEAERRLPREVVDAFVAAGIFKLMVPRAYGGADASVREAIEVIEAISRVDGSAGWCANISILSGTMAHFLDEATAREVYGPADAITCGVFAPTGTAVPEGDGYRVSGRWSFASGCEYSGWRMAGVIVPGSPRPLHCLLRADQTRIVDTWDACGLRGTGSHDFVADDALVPRARTFSLVITPDRAGFGPLAAGIAAVSLGVARAAIDSFVATAKVKPLAGGNKPIASRELVQVEVASAEARLGAARAYLLEQAGNGVAIGERARLRLAATHAVEAAIEVCSAMFRAAGGGAVYTRNPLQRYLRDAQVVAQHIMVGSLVTTTIGRILLDIETDTSTL
ncbi:MAG: hydroxylase [Deltaproteobacteria bacterium]|nr:MAG: hydroxylase [Deltaproteobacteria bacterium]TMQ21920.1 MAG: hydroxylase [Deltaproteobacteria bacterium]